MLPGERVLVSRGTGSTLLKLTREGGAWKAAPVWSSARLKGALGPTVHESGSLFGFSGQYLLCVDLATGEPRWREKTNSGALIRVGHQLVVLGDQSGLLRLAEAEPGAYRERARAAAFNPGAQSTTGPSYANGRVFVRNVEEMAAFALGERTGRRGPAMRGPDTRDRRGAARGGAPLDAVPGSAAVGSRLAPVARAVPRRPRLRDVGAPRRGASSAADRVAAVRRHRHVGTQRLGRPAGDARLRRQGQPRASLSRHATGRSPGAIALDPGIPDDERGPGSTPAIADGLVFVLSPACQLRALDVASGKTAWQVDLKTQFGAKPRRAARARHSSTASG